MSLETLKLNRQIASSMEEAGFVSPKEIQEKTFSRIMGGQDVIAVGPEGSGKTTTAALTVLMKLKYAQEEAPRALILVRDKERGQELIDKLQLLGKNTDIRVLGLFPGAGLEGQREALAEGTDVAVGTPDRVQAIYYKSGINLNRLKLFILDDADLLIKQGFNTIIHQLSQSIPKCQHLVFTEVAHEKLYRLTRNFMNYPVLIEVEGEPENRLDTISLFLYQAPNYKTKLNLLNLLMRDAEAFTKVLVFANTSYTSEKLYKSLNRRIPGEVALLKAPSDHMSVNDLREFESSPELRVLILSNKEQGLPETGDIPVILHFDLPEEKEIFIDRVRKGEEEVEERISITFATDLELNQVRKIEQATGQKFHVEDLPPDLVIEGDPHSREEDEEEEQAEKKAREEPERGAAFHEKKPENAKNYNYSYKDKLKKFGKKHRPGKRLKD